MHRTSIQRYAHLQIRALRLRQLLTNAITARRHHRCIATRDIAAISSSAPSRSPVFSGLHRSRWAVSNIHSGSTESSHRNHGQINNTTRRKKQRRTPRVVVAMSGGVDSSVAAYLLQRNSKHEPAAVVSPSCLAQNSVDKNNMEKEMDVEVVGVHMSNWSALDEDSDIIDNTTKDARKRNNRNNYNSQQHQQSSSPSPSPMIGSSASSSPSNSTFCQASEQEYNDAQTVAQHLNIPLHRVSFASEYWIQVFEPFVESLSSSSSSSSLAIENNSNDDSQCSGGGGGGGGEFTTPNPDFGCNTFIKFGAMKDYAMNRLDADFVATGHYAQLWHREHALTKIHRDNMLSSEGSNHFLEWMMETSLMLEQTVIKSLAGRPEEEWILNNNGNAHSLVRNNDTHQLPPMLLAGADRTKDQSYFLSGVKSEAFRNVIFPLGHLAKSSTTTRGKSATGNKLKKEFTTNNTVLVDNDNQYQQSVRDIAHEANIPTASKRDSMGICFIGKRNFAQFMSQYLHEPPIPGNFVDVDTGEIVGRHEGTTHYTLGQGAKISGANKRYFVCGKGGGGEGGDPTTVFVCNDTHHSSLYTDELSVDFESFNWIGLDGGGGEGGVKGGQCNNNDSIPRPLVDGHSIKLWARTRHLQPLAPCTVTWKHSEFGDMKTMGDLVVRFDFPMRAITPGQIVSLYAGNNGLICLGGGPIRNRGASFMDRGWDVPLGLAHPSGHNDLSLCSR